MTAQAAKKRTQHYRENSRKKGGVILYAMITNPEAVAAWKELQKIFGNNKDAIEDAILTSYEQLKDQE